MKKKIINITRVELLEELQSAQKRIAELKNVISSGQKDSPNPKLDDKFSTLFETMALGVVYQDVNGNTVDANPAAENILGLTLSQLQERTSSDPRWKSIHQDGSEFLDETHPAMIALQTSQPRENARIGVYNPDVA